MKIIADGPCTSGMPNQQFDQPVRKVERR